MKNIGRLFFFLVVCATSLHSATTPRDYAVDLQATVSDTTPHITLSWTARLTPTAPPVLHRRLKGETVWGTLAALTTSQTSYADATALPGLEYEYWLELSSESVAGPMAYLAAGVKVPEIAVRGTLLLVIDDTMLTPLASEITQLTADLTGDGWTVQQIVVPRSGSAISTKALITAAYNADPANVKSVYLLGHVPVPYSGLIAPDGHGEHYGAWPADCYYGDMTGTWTDTSVNRITATDPLNRNIPGDGKFDQNDLYQKLIKLNIGRVDLSGMTEAPGAGVSEASLLRRYLQKAHNYRQKIGAYADIPRRSLIRDGFGMGTGEPFAVAGWVGAFTDVNHSSAAIDEAPVDNWFSPAYAGGQSYLWGYGCGGGSPSSAYSVGTASDFGHKPSRVVFTSLFGSWFGDWGPNNNLMRSVLAGTATGDSLGLACFWSGRPNWFPHHLGMGETMGYMAMRSMNADVAGGGVYGPIGTARKGIHLGLMGDPALRFHVVFPPRALAGTSVSGSVSLNWAASTEPSLQGYHVYRAATTAGPFTKLTSAPLTGTTYTDTTVTPGQSYTYLVRTLKLESVPGGSYYNLSVGVPLTLVASSAASAPPLNPSDLSVLSQMSVTSTQIAWADNSSNETGFVIQRRANAGSGMGSWSPVATLTAGSTNYTDAGPFTNGNVYEYQVLAVNSAGNSIPSNRVSIEASAGFLEFTSTKTKVNKSGGIASVTVQRYGGGVGAVTVQCSTSDHSALAGTHYTSTSSTLSWADGEQGGKTFSIPVSSTTPQIARELRVTLSNPTGGASIASYSSMAVLIVDPLATLAAPWNWVAMGAAEGYFTDSSPAVSAEGMIADATMGGSGLGVVARTMRGEMGGFTYRSITGDGVLTVQIPSPTTSDAAGNSRFAVMVRAGTTPWDIMAAAVAATPEAGRGTTFSYRPASGSEVLLSSTNTYSTPQWLRISRAGSTFTAESSGNGSDWINLGSMSLPTMPATANWGMFHCSSDWYWSSNYSGDYQVGKYQNISFTALPSPSASPLLTLGSVSATAVAMNWAAVPYAAGYRIERRTENSRFEQIANVLETVLTFTDATVQGNTPYQYRVVAYNSTGESAPSAALGVVTPSLVSPLLLRPGFLTATLGGSSSVNLAWVDSNLTETGFQIERRVANGQWSLLTTAPANTTNFTDSTALPGVLYEYRIRAATAADNSSWATLVSLLHASVATVNHPVWSPDGVQLNQWTESPGNGYVPNGLMYYPVASSFVGTSAVGTLTRNNFGGWLGMKITVGATPLTLRELGRWVIAGNTGIHIVKIVDAATSADVPGGAVSVATAGTPAGMRYAVLPAPVTLPANKAYLIVSQETSGGDSWYEAGAVHTYNSSIATINNAIYSSSPTTYADAYSANQCYVPVGFKYSIGTEAFLTGHSMTVLRNDLTGWMGMKMTIGATDLWINQLGRWVAPGNAGTHAVKIVHADTGEEIASASISTAGAPAGQMKYAPLSAGVTLAANTAYYILSQETAGGDQWYDCPAAGAGTATGYQQWLLANGLPMDASGEGSATATPASDGLPNLIKYALGLTPTVSGNGGHLSSGTMNISGADYPTFTYTCPTPAPTDITYVVETSGDLAAWSSSGLVQVSNTVNVGLQTLTIRESMPISGGTKRFMRLKITQPEIVL